MSARRAESASFSRAEGRVPRCEERARAPASWPPREGRSARPPGPVLPVVGDPRQPLLDAAAQLVGIAGLVGQPQERLVGLTARFAADRRRGEKARARRVGIAGALVHLAGARHRLGAERLL